MLQLELEFLQSNLWLSCSSYLLKSLKLEFIFVQILDTGAGALTELLLAEPELSQTSFLFGRSFVTSSNP